MVYGRCLGLDLRRAREEEGRAERVEVVPVVVVVAVAGVAWGRAGNGGGGGEVRGELLEAVDHVGVR